MQGRAPHVALALRRPAQYRHPRCRGHHAAAQRLQEAAAIVSDALAAAAGGWCGSKLEVLNLSGNPVLRGSVANVAAPSGYCSQLNLFGDAVGADKDAGGGGQGFAALDGWMVGAGLGSVRWLGLA